MTLCRRARQSCHSGIARTDVCTRHTISCASFSSSQSILRCQQSSWGCRRKAQHFQLCRQAVRGLLLHCLLLSVLAGKIFWASYSSCFTNGPLQTDVFRCLKLWSLSAGSNAPAADAELSKPEGTPPSIKALRRRTSKANLSQLAQESPARSPTSCTTGETRLMLHIVPDSLCHAASLQCSGPLLCRCLNGLCDQAFRRGSSGAQHLGRNACNWRGSFQLWVHIWRQHCAAGCSECAGCSQQTVSCVWRHRCPAACISCGAWPGRHSADIRIWQQQCTAGSIDRAAHNSFWFRSRDGRGAGSHQPVARGRGERGQAGPHFWHRHSSAGSQFGGSWQFSQQRVQLWQWRCSDRSLSADPGVCGKQ